MEVLSVIRARSIWLFDVNDLNPRGKSLHGLIDWLKHSYRFSKVPASLTDSEKDTNALAFLDGTLQIREDVSITADLRIYNDGMVADTRSSTKDTDTFLDDVLSRAAKEFNLVYKPEMIHTRLCSSELNVRYNLPLVKLNQRLAAFAEKLSRITKLPREPAFELSGLVFWDSKAMMQPNPSAFRLERKLNTPTSQNRYYSLAPVGTDEHIELLNELEAILSGA